MLETWDVVLKIKWPKYRYTESEYLNACEFEQNSGYI